MLFPSIPAAIYYSPMEKEFSRMPTSVSVTVISRWVLFVSGRTCPGCVIWLQCLLINKPSLQQCGSFHSCHPRHYSKMLSTPLIGSHRPSNLINLNPVSLLPRGRRSTPALHLPHSSSSPQAGTNSLEKFSGVRHCNHRFPQAEFCLR